jgi:hypothetical protein
MILLRSTSLCTFVTVIEVNMSGVMPYTVGTATILGGLLICMFLLDFFFEEKEVSTTDASLLK